MGSTRSRRYAVLGGVMTTVVAGLVVLSAEYGLIQPIFGFASGGSAATTTTTSPSAEPTTTTSMTTTTTTTDHVPPPLDLAGYPTEDVAGFDDLDDYEPHDPNESADHPYERPIIEKEDTFKASSESAPYFVLSASRFSPSTLDVVSVATVGRFVGTGRVEDSLFVGWMQDTHNYITTWCNHTKKKVGINVLIEGSPMTTDETADAELESGDRLALASDGETITAYIYVNGEWERKLSVQLGHLLSSQYYYCFGVKATLGQISVSGFEGRSR